MQNELAKMLVTAADKYRDREHKHADAEEDKKFLDMVKSDYEDLVSIANMIEADEDPKSIARAMWKLDTLVRDVIPDNVYNAYAQ